MKTKENTIEVYFVWCPTKIQAVHLMYTKSITSYTSTIGASLQDPSHVRVDLHTISSTGQLLKLLVLNKQDMDDEINYYTHDNSELYNFLQANLTPRKGTGIWR